MLLLLLLISGALAQGFERKFDDDGKRIPLTEEEKALRKAAAQERGRNNKESKDTTFHCQDIDIGSCDATTSDNDDETCRQAVMDNDEFMGYAFTEGGSPSCYLLNREQWTCANDAQDPGDGTRTMKVCRDKSVPRKIRGTIKIDQTKVVNAIKTDMRENHRNAIMQLEEVEDKQNYIKNLISDYLDGDEDRDNTEENIDLIYQKLIKKQDSTDDGLFKNIMNYSVNQVDQMRETELEKLFNESKQAFLDDFNAKHPDDYTGPLYTLDGESPYGYFDAVKVVREAKNAARAALKEAQGEGKLTRQGESVKVKNKALKKAKHAAKSFDRKSKYQKWQKRHDRKAATLDKQQKNLDLEYEKIAKACQRIKIDLRRESVPKDDQLDEFVKRLSQRGLEDWASTVLFKNSADVYTCIKSKMKQYYDRETGRISQKKQDNLDDAANAENNWNDSSHKDNEEGETNLQKRNRMQAAFQQAKQEYDDAVAAETARRANEQKLIVSGYAELAVPNKQKEGLREKAKNKVNRKQGQSRFTP